MRAGALAVAVFGLIVFLCAMLLRIHWIMTFHISLIVHLVQFIIVWREFGALLRVLGALLQGRFQGLLKLAVVHAVPVEAALDVVILLLVVVHELAELPQLILQALPIILLVAIGETLIL